MPGAGMKKIAGEKRRRQSGVALLVTLLVVSLLIAVTVELHRNIRASVFSTASTRVGRQLDWAASSGIAIGMAVLVKDKKHTKYDSIQEEWADEQEIRELLSEFSFDGAKIDLQITDIMGKIQINALVKPPHGQHFRQDQNELWDRFLRPIVSQYEDLDLNATTDIINSIKDWLDREDDDAITGLNGAESDYYEALDPPYFARNDLMTDVQDLLLIKGVTKELFFGSEAAPGIGGHITTYGATSSGKTSVEYIGKINMGTAESLVMRAVMPVDSEDLAESIIEYRDERDDDGFINTIGSNDWYKNAPGCSDLKLDPSVFTNESDYFEIKCKALYGGVEKTVTAVVLRQKITGSPEYECKILSWLSK